MGRGVYINMIEENEQNVYDVLESLGIKYVRYQHKPLYTVNDAKEIGAIIQGGKCKNLFLRNRKGDSHYLVVVDENKRVDLKSLAKQIGTAGLSFASVDRLYKYLMLTPGSVTPFGVINDANSEVKILIDKDLVNEELVNFHPNINTATIGISYEDFIKFIKWHKNELFYVEIK